MKKGLKTVSIPYRNVINHLCPFSPKNVRNVSIPYRNVINKEYSAPQPEPVSIPYRNVINCPYENISSVAS